MQADDSIFPNSTEFRNISLLQNIKCAKTTASFSAYNILAIVCVFLSVLLNIICAVVIRYHFRYYMVYRIYGHMCVADVFGLLSLLTRISLVNASNAPCYWHFLYTEATEFVYQSLWSVKEFLTVTISMASYLVLQPEGQEMRLKSVNLACLLSWVTPILFTAIIMAIKWYQILVSNRPSHFFEARRTYYGIQNSVSVFIGTILFLLFCVTMVKIRRMRNAVQPLERPFEICRKQMMIQSAVIRIISSSSKLGLG
uniref:G-protein coupled receptors family 1 profile domain-containing protein n=1 Tax=Romanomermis culicivorax TaxID=13658 RepID=A0A915I4X9_ROMCU